MKKLLNPKEQVIISNNIRRLRNGKKWTQPNLAEKLGCVSGAVSSWERGRTEPSMSIVLKMCDVFNCSISEFFNKVELQCNPYQVEPEKLEKKKERQRQIIQLYNGLPEQKQVLAYNMVLTLEKMI